MNNVFKMKFMKRSLEKKKLKDINSGKIPDDAKEAEESTKGQKKAYMWNKDSSDSDSSDDDTQFGLSRFTQSHSTCKRTFGKKEEVKHELNDIEESLKETKSVSNRFLLQDKSSKGTSHRHTNQHDSNKKRKRKNDKNSNSNVFKRFRVKE
ncbi:unnamed protein product [Moneuplotes crassus]|uniref:Uncharacterized protein n=1 Tax=Euplotes crassus TaxID=5936 RepID=A0AAD1XWL5_EUPCR|nr:unnamed protein product [Moneuplotes crassus]